MNVMKKLIPFALLTTTLAVIQYFLPWWSAFLAAAAFFYLWRGPGISPFVMSFSAGFLVWMLTAGISDFQHGFALSTMLMSLLGGIPSWAVYLITAVVGGITPGLGGWCGRLARQAVSGEATQNAPQE